MVKQIVYKWIQFRTIATLPRNEHLVKSAPRVQWTILKVVKKKTKSNSKRPTEDSTNYRNLCSCGH